MCQYHITQFSLASILPERLPKTNLPSVGSRYLSVGGTRQDTGVLGEVRTGMSLLLGSHGLLCQPLYIPRVIAPRQKASQFGRCSLRNHRQRRNRGISARVESSDP